MASHEKLLQYARETGAASAQLLEDFFELAGLSLPQKLSFTAESLGTVEIQYHRLQENPTQDENLSIDELERLMAYFLGEVIVRQIGAEWVIYGGPEHVFSPTVVKVNATGLHRDVFMLCSGFGRKNHLLGARQNRALQTFFQGSEHSGFD